MMDLLLKGVGWTDIALLLNRVAVGTFFMLSGRQRIRSYKPIDEADRIDDWLSPIPTCK
jgi:hypothetical protein